VRAGLAVPPPPLEWILRAVVGALLIALPSLVMRDLTVFLAALLYGALLLPLGALEAWFMRRSVANWRWVLAAAWLLASLGIMVVNAQSAFSNQILQGASAGEGFRHAWSSLRLFLHPFVAIAFLGHAFMFATCSALRVEGWRGSELLKRQGGVALATLVALQFVPGPSLSALTGIYLLWVFGCALPLAGELGERWRRGWESARRED
jgi:hypothetical protein